MLNINICIATVCECKYTTRVVPKVRTALKYLTYFNGKLVPTETLCYQATHLLSQFLRLKHLDATTL